jgi:bifunctional enzyme CysN/CysC
MATTTSAAKPVKPSPSLAQPTVSERETMNVVIVGHVDHGKSTLVGRLLADTGVLGDGKLEKVKETCRRQGKQFEYAFLLDALEEEQGQGITIDAARVFFRSDQRDYIIIDAPGHIEFLKNMVTGAARAEAAILLIDAKEGVRENSRRHGYLMSMLGIRQIAVAVNKIDLVDYSQVEFEKIVAEYRAFLAEIGVEARHFIPMAAREGACVAARSDKLAWYQGPTILEAFDGFDKKRPRTELPLRLPVQDIYKFNERGDDRRIIAGRIETGRLQVGDTVMFSPSGKSTKIESIEVFSAPPKTTAEAGQSVGVTLAEQIYVTRGELVSHLGTVPEVSTKLRVNLFWLGRSAMEIGKKYKLKIGSAATEVTIDTIHRVLDASKLDSTLAKSRVDRHDVADLVLRTRQPIAFDPAADLEITGRFVIVDGYDIAGGGIVREVVADELRQRRLERRVRDTSWAAGDVTPDRRAELYGHPASMVMITGPRGSGKMGLARALERRLIDSDHRAYLLNGKNLVLGVDADVELDDIEEIVRRFGEVAHLMLDAGLLVVSTTNVIGPNVHGTIATQVAPFPTFVVHLGASDVPEAIDLKLEPGVDPEKGAEQVLRQLAQKGRLRRGEGG